MKYSLLAVLFALLLALTFAQEEAKNNNNNNDAIPIPKKRAAMLQKLKRTLDEKKQMMRDHESGHRRLNDEEFSDTLRVIDHAQFQIKKYKALSDQDLRHDIAATANKKREEAAAAAAAARKERQENAQKKSPPKPERVLGGIADETVRRRKAEEKRQAAEEQKSQRIKQLESLLLKRQDQMTLHNRGHRTLTDRELEQTEMAISQFTEKLEWVKKTPAEELMARKVNSKNNMQRRMSGSQPPPTSATAANWKSSNLSFMEAMNAPPSGGRAGNDKKKD